MTNQPFPYDPNDMVIAYVLVRGDAPDFNIGKACAQTHHNGTEMTEDLLEKNFPALNLLYEEWKSDVPAELRAWEAEQELVAALDLSSFEKVVGPNKEIELLQRIAVEARAEANRLKRKFGTVLTMAVTAAQMRQAVSVAQLLGLHAKITNDPTYPIRDGDRYTTASVDSCAYIFGRKSQCYPATGQFDLLSEKSLAAIQNG